MYEWHSGTLQSVGQVRFGAKQSILVTESDNPPNTSPPTHHTNETSISQKHCFLGCDVIEK